MLKVSKISIFAFARFQSKFALLLGLFFGVIYAFGGFIIDILVSVNLLSSASFHSNGLGAGTLLAFAALLGMPILFAILGFVLGIAEALLYKIYLRYFRAIEIDFWQ